MPSYYRISPAIWNEDWDETTRHLAFYLLTTSHRTTEGLFKLPAVFIQVDLGWTLKKIEKHLKVLEADDVIKRSGDVILILKALKHQSPSNPNQVKAALRALETVPPSPLDAEFFELAERFSERLAERLPQEFPKRFGQRLTKPPALAPPPTQTPPPPRGDGGEMDLELQTQELRGRFMAKGFELDDIDVLLERLELRARGLGEPVSDWAAWMETALPKLQKAREVRNGAVSEIDVDGETFRRTDRGWELAEVAS